VSTDYRFLVIFGLALVGLVLAGALLWMALP
jgi:hypothetical protein